MDVKNYTSECKGKINLSLSIVGVSKGLHLLDSIMANVDIKDMCTYVPGPLELVIDIIDNTNKIDVPKYRTVLMSAIDKMCTKFGPLGGHIVLEKNVPLAAGLGGSTSSIVCILKAFEEYLKDNNKFVQLDNQFLCSIGSDVPFMYKGGIARVQGVGEKVTPLIDRALKTPMYVLMLFENDGIDTRNCYALYDELAKNNYDKPLNDINILSLELKNSLSLPAIKMNPKIGENIELLKRVGAKNVSMTGSGSTVFAVSINYQEMLSFVEKISKIKKINYKISKIL